MKRRPRNSGFKGGLLDGKRTVMFWFLMTDSPRRFSASEVMDIVVHGRFWK